FVLPAAGSPGKRTLFRAYRARARAPVGAGAVRAPSVMGGFPSSGFFNDERRDPISGTRT
ncbi:MAG: hypothetical protein OXE50_15815, partial [Chloroflexi bacterium]|nr:hypothetical protein [Chloroflexota bacterium]